MLRYHSLVLIPSDHCNISCRHCAPECGPTVRHPWDVPLLERCISEAAQIPNLRKNIHFAGGEPFLYFAQMLQLARHAHRHHFSSSIVTNGFWGVNKVRAAGMIAGLVEHGLRRVELSVDHFHLEFLPVRTIRQSIEVLKQAGVFICMRVVTTRKHQIDETLRQFTPDDLDGVEVNASGLIPTGRAIREVNSDEYYSSPEGGSGSCAAFLNLTIRPDGNVGPCCAGAENTPSLSLGNVHSLPLDRIAQNAERNLFLKQVVEEGPSSFFERLRDADLGHKIRSEYTSICQACSELFRDAEVVQALGARTDHSNRNDLVNISVV
ncbi:MAG TPA: radical SAM protein [Bryobacteraceae bacterium]|nr:radical SAM protein [Bryobacteraceae bacterium]